MFQWGKRFWHLFIVIKAVGNVDVDLDKKIIHSFASLVLTFTFNLDKKLEWKQNLHIYMYTLLRGRVYFGWGGLLGHISVNLAPF